MRGASATKRLEYAYESYHETRPRQSSRYVPYALRLEGLPSLTTRLVSRHVAPNAYSGRVVRILVSDGVGSTGSERPISHDAVARARPRGGSQLGATGGL